MRRPAAWVVMALALGALILVPRAAAQAQDAREGPREIAKCKMINKPGSYRLVNDLTFTDTTGTCLTITVDLVTIDLAGFAISGPGFTGNPTTAIASAPPSRGQLFGITYGTGRAQGLGPGSISTAAMALSLRGYASSAAAAPATLG